MALEVWTVGLSHVSVAPRAAARAEAHGFDGMVVVDSQNLAGDPFVGLALAARETSTLHLGTGVTNPATRHPAAAAAAIASVHVASGASPGTTPTASFRLCTPTWTFLRLLSPTPLALPGSSRPSMTTSMPASCRLRRGVGFLALRAPVLTIVEPPIGSNLYVRTAEGSRTHVMG